MALFAPTIFEAQKLIFIMLLSTFAVVCQRIGYRHLALGLIACIPLMYTVATPAIYMAIGLYGFLRIYRRDAPTIAETLIACTTAGYLLAYYFIFNSTSSRMSAVEMDYRNLVNLGHTVNIIGGTAIGHAVLFFPISIIFTLIFCCMNLFMIPVALIYHSFLLFSLIF